MHTARKRKRDSMRCMMEALPLCAMAAGSLSLRMDFRRGLNGLTPEEQHSTPVKIEFACLQHGSAGRIHNTRLTIEDVMHCLQLIIMSKIEEVPELPVHIELIVRLCYGFHAA